ncbi:hypothetical protein ACFE04_024802 [Oxalis oulophora]
MKLATTITIEIVILLLSSFLYVSSAKSFMDTLFPTSEVTITNNANQTVQVTCDVKELEMGDEHRLFLLHPEQATTFKIQQILFPLHWCYVRINKDLYGTFWAYTVRDNCGVSCKLSIRDDGVYVYNPAMQTWDTRFRVPRSNCHQFDVFRPDLRVATITPVFIKFSMGCKRPFEDEEFQELPFRQSRRVDYTDKLTQFSDTFHSTEAHQKPILLGESGEQGLHQVQQTKASEKETAPEIPNLADREFEHSVPLSWVTNNSGDEDAVSGQTTFSPLSPEYFECDNDIPRKNGSLDENDYASLLNGMPKKIIPIGPNHQAQIPEWSNKLDKEDHENDERLMGTCIIPMPDPNMLLHNINLAGVIKNGCYCLDEGSVRCARQHVKESRDNLMKSLGFEKFVRLGLYDMGEEVARKWTVEEERLFQEAVYANPARLGRNFWKCLSAVFPFRLRKEIVSYYFNVFILRRRAAQNRSSFLEIDSDDDEPLGFRRCPYESLRVLREEDEDSDIDTDGSLNDEDDDKDDNDDDNCSGDGDVGDYQVAPMPEVNANSFDNNTVKGMDKISGDVAGEYNVEDDSCTSFELESDTVDSNGPNNLTGSLYNDMKTDNFDGCENLGSQVYLMDSCDASDWGGRYLMSPAKGVDFLPTSNIIEEIFGQGTPEMKK